MNKGPNNSKREENEKLNHGIWNNRDNRMNIIGQNHKIDIQIGNIYLFY